VTVASKNVVQGAGRAMLSDEVIGRGWGSNFNRRVVFVAECQRDSGFGLQVPDGSFVFGGVTSGLACQGGNKADRW
jgi:hypothetical protein